MTICEDFGCGNECLRRIQCVHCGLYICGWCWHHVHGCEPGHKPKDCIHRKLTKARGKVLLKGVRDRTLARAR